MLQFKVCPRVFLFCFNLNTPSTLTNTHTDMLTSLPRPDLGPNHGPLRGSGAADPPCDSCDQRKQQALQSHRYQQTLRDPGHKEENRHQDVSMSVV